MLFVCDILIHTNIMSNFVEPKICISNPVRMNICVIKPEALSAFASVDLAE